MNQNQINQKKSAEDFLKETIALIEKARAFLETSFKKIENYSVKEKSIQFENYCKNILPKIE